MTAKKIMYNSDEAAKHVTVSGWMSADGIFWPDKDDPKFAEHHARWGGCTHLICECGNEFEKGYTKCHDCQKTQSDADYQALPFKEWEKEPLCLWQDDYYFFSLEDLKFYAKEHEIEDLSTIQLVICEPQYPSRLDADEYYAEFLPENMELSDVAPNLAAAIADANDIVEKQEEVLSWAPSNVRTTINFKIGAEE